jgi:hypothetical protein
MRAGPLANRDTLDLIQLAQEATAGLSSREKQLFLYDVGHRLFWRKPVK